MQGSGKPTPYAIKRGSGKPTPFNIGIFLKLKRGRCTMFYRRVVLVVM